MRRTHTSYIDVILWGLVFYLTLHVPLIEMRTNDEDTTPQPQTTPAPPPPTTKQPDPTISIEEGKCFHRNSSHCPNNTLCKLVDPVSVFCCNVTNSSLLKEELQKFVNQNMTYLHVLNARVDELNVSVSMYRRLTHLAFTDGKIGKISGQFPRHAPISCLNISNNNLSSAKLDPGVQRPFANLFKLTTLDASANNLTEFPLSLVQRYRPINVDFSGNDYLPCKHFQKAMEVEANNSSLVNFTNYDKTKCALDLSFNWFEDIRIVPIDHVRKQRDLNKICDAILPKNINCTCVPMRWELLGGEISNRVAVDCTKRHLKVMPTNLPENTIKLNVSYNNITSLQTVADDPTYEDLRQLIVDHNEIQSIVELEGTKFIDNFMLFSINHNKLKTIQTYVLSNKFDRDASTYTSFSIAGNYIHCDCNTDKVLKAWLLENFRNIPDYKELQCQNVQKSVVDLIENEVCHTPRDWTDYIYYIIGLEVLVLITLISKVSYDYWVFKTAGYLPWPANKMPRLPCDWLCE